MRRAAGPGLREPRDVSDVKGGREIIKLDGTHTSY
jgi:hypothetical protein